MDTISMADAKAHLGALIARAEAGESVCITRRGKPVARLAPMEEPRTPFDWDALRRHTDSMPYQEEGAGDFIRRVRNEVRY